MPCSTLQEAVVFLNPPYKYTLQRKLRCSPRRSGYVFPPLELLYLASLTGKDGMQQVFIDAIAEKLTLKETVERLKKYRVRLMIFMPGFESFAEDLKTIAEIKSQLGKETYSVAFGYLPTLYYEDIFQRFPLLDCIILGEPEITFRELYTAVLLNNKKPEEIKGLALNRNGRVVLSGERDEQVDLETLVFPDRRLLKNERYSDPFLKKPMTSMVTSRGCPYQCAFCVNFYGKTFRQRSAENIIRELKHIVNELHIRNIRFVDDNLTTDRERLIAVCRGMLADKMGLSWTCLSRIDTLDRELLGYMSKAGCKAVFLGIESGSQKVLDSYKKGYTVEMIKKKCALIKESGIDIVSWFMLGAPLENADDVRQSIRLALEVDSDFICLNEFKPMPLTPIFPELKERVAISLFPFNISYTPFSLNPAQVAHWRRVFYFKFYFSPKTIRRFLLRFIRKPAGLIFFLREFISSTRRKYIEK